MYYMIYTRNERTITTCSMSMSSEKEKEKIFINGMVEEKSKQGKKD